MVARRKLLSEFKYEDHAFESTLGEREARDMKVMDNMARYTGEWHKTKNVR